MPMHHVQLEVRKRPQPAVDPVVRSGVVIGWEYGVFTLDVYVA